MSSSPLRQLALQGAAAILVLSLAWPYFGVQGEALPWLETSLAIGGVALLFATLSRQPWWWRVIHAGFMPLVWFTQSLAIDPGWFLFAAALLLLVYRGALTGQVPLYLSNKQTVQALAELIAARGDTRFLDLGAGVGSTTVPLERLLVEHSVSVNTAAAGGNAADRLVVPAGVWATHAKGEAGLPKSTPFSFQILAPSRPIMP